MTPRRAAEWPYQLHAAAAWERLERCLTDIALFIALYNSRAKWELTGYWHPLRDRGRDMGDCCAAAYQKWIAIPSNAGDRYVVGELGTFLGENGLYEAAEHWVRRALEARERVLGPEQLGTLTSMNNLAVLLQRKGDYTGAEPLLRRALEVSERVFGKDHPHTLTCMNSLAVLLQHKGDYVAQRRCAPGAGNE